MKQWWLIGLLALALTMSACGKDDKDSKEAVVAKKPHKKKRRKRRKRKRSAKKGDKDAKDSAKKGDKKTAQAKKGVADVKGEKGRAKAGGDADAPADTGKKARPPRPSKMAAKGAPTPEAVAADAAKALAEARKAAKANAAAPGAPDPAEAAKAAAVAPAAAAPAVAAAAAPAGEVPVAAKGAAEAAAKAADAAKAAKAADAAKAANAAAEAQAAERQAAVLRGRPPEPSLDISGYLSAADLERVLGKKWKFQRADLSGIKPNKGYNAVYYARGGRKGRFGVSLQVWRDLNLVDSRTRFNTMKNTYTDVVATNKVREQGFRAYYGGVVSLVFVDPRRPLLASVSCATKVCKADALIELSRRVAERLR